MMNNIGQPERHTQNRVIALFRQELGYRFLADRTDRHNSNIEEQPLSDWLEKSGHNQARISRALHILRTEASNPNRSLYENNRTVYGLLHYGVQVKTDAGKATDTVQLINWPNQKRTTLPWPRK